MHARTATSMQLESAGDDAISNKKQLDEARSNELNNSPFIRGDVYEGTVDSNGTIRLKTTRRVQGAIVLESDVACEAQVYRQRKGLAEIKVTAQWEFLDRIDFTVAAQAKNFTFDPYALDNYYKIEGYWLAGGDSASNLYWYINDSYIDGRTMAGAAGAAAQRTGTLLAYNAPDGEKVVVDSKLTKNGDMGLINGLAAHRLTTNVDGGALNGAWYGGTGKVTTLGVASNNADAIDPGSYFELFRKRDFNNTKIKLWVY